MAKQDNSRKLASFEAVIQYTFLPDQASEVIAYITSAVEILDLKLILLDTGYEVSQAYNPDRKNFSVCIKGIDKACVNAGRWLYGNGDTLHLAYCSAFYKHFVIFEQKVWNGNSSGSGMAVS